MKICDMTDVILVEIKNGIQLKQLGKFILYLIQN